MQKYTDKAIILSRVDFGERDRILILLSETHGKIRLIAKGVRVPKSKLAGGIELFSETQIGAVAGKGSLSTLTSSRLITHFSNIVHDLDKTMMAYEFLKTISKVTHDDHGQDYYPALLFSLQGLDDRELNPTLVQLWFELQILQHSGVSMNLKTDTNNIALKESPKYKFDYEKHCFSADSGGVYTPKHLKLLRIFAEHSKPVKVDAEPKVIDESAKLVHILLENNVLS